MTAADEVRNWIEAEGLKCRVIDLTPPLEVILAGLTGGEREFVDFITYAKLHSTSEAAIISAPEL